MKTELTPEEIAKMKVVRDKWIGMLIRDEPLDKTKVTTAMNWLYDFCSLPANPKIVLAKSPQQAQIIANMLSDGADPDSIDCEKINTNKIKPAKFFSFLNYGNVSDYGWCSFYDYFDQIGIEIIDKFKEYRDIYLSSGIYDAICFDTLAIVVEKPLFVHKDETGRMHNVEGPAIGWSDGFELFFITGRNMPAYIFDKAKITRKKFLTEKNAEYKMGMYAVMGQKAMMELLGADVVDSCTHVHANGDVEMLELLKTKNTFAEIDNQPFAWVKMICPSTGAQYLQGCEPHFTKALDAVASLAGMSGDEYKLDLRS